MSAAIEDILHRIEMLADTERIELQERLTRLFEAEWEREISSAREEAARRKIDDDAIEAAISRARYGK